MHQRRKLLQIFKIFLMRWQQFSKLSKNCLTILAWFTCHFCALTRPAIKEHAKLILCGFEARALVGGKLATGTIDVEREHRHR